MTRVLVLRHLEGHHVEEIIICGGGLGGLSAAAALAQKGIRSIVLEKARQFGETGAGIQIGPNGFRALHELDISKALRTSCVFIDDLKLMSALSGQEITRIPLGKPFLDRFVFPYAVVHRQELHKILLSLCQASNLVEFRLQAEVVRYEQNQDFARVYLSDGACVRGKAVIGADGLHSKIRQSVVGDGAPIVSGNSTFRTIVARYDMPKELRCNAGVLWAGPGVHAVHYPLSGSTMYNLVANCEDGSDVALRGAPVPAQKVQAYFAGMVPVLQDLIGIGENWKHWVLCDREPVTRWVDHRVALLGDAAHPMLQYFAQGACMAFEDAMVLAQALHENPDNLAKGLQVYQSQRHTRTARVQRQSRSVGAYICHAKGPLAAYRDRNLSKRLPERWFDVLEWIYGET